MSLFATLLDTLPNASVQEVRVGTSCTAVVVQDQQVAQDQQSEQQPRCGLASTLGAHIHQAGQPPVADAGRLAAKDARDLAQLVHSPQMLEVSIGLAAMNALLPQDPARWTDANAGDLLVQAGAGKRVALVGHFPFVAQLRQTAATLWVLELNPQEGDLPAGAAADVIPQADILALTGTTLINGTFDALMALRRPDAWTMMLGPTTPLSPILFDVGVNVLAGAVVTEIDPVLTALSQGATFRQLRHQGVRLVTMQKPGTRST